MKILKIILSILVAIFLVVGVPVIINECYKVNCGYITVWDGADVLAYYGVLLGAAIAVGVLVATISFNTKQLRRERFLEKERLKWDKTEEVIMQTLQDASPLNMSQTFVDPDESTILYISKVISHLQDYALKLKTSIVVIKCYITPEDYKKVENLITEIGEATKMFYGIEAEMEQAYTEFRTVLANYNGLAPQDKLIAYTNKTAEISRKIIPAYEQHFLRLYDIKRETFAIIYSDMDTQADQIIKLGRKRGK